MNRAEQDPHDMRLDKFGHTLDRQNVAHVVKRIADYPEIIAAVRALDAALAAQEGERGGAEVAAVEPTVRAALTYIAQPSIACPPDRQPAEFASTDATDHLVRVALATCIRLAQDALDTLTADRIEAQP